MVCRSNDIKNEASVWALAADLEEKGDRGLMAYLWEADVPAAVAKVRMAMGAKDFARRAQLTRMEILQEVLEKRKCTCKSQGTCFLLMKEVLDKNCIDGNFQQEVIATLQSGRKKMRNLCLVGPMNTAKSYLFKGLTLIFKTYSRPDGGSYQMEEMLGKELIFLNDFEYDDDAKKWCPWQYFKRFLEGEDLTIACPKNRGGNQPFDSDAPVFLTAPQEISLYRGKQRDEYETKQMRTRVKYCNITAEIKKEDLKEVDPCAHCAARVYLEGLVTTGQAASSSSGVKRPAEQMGNSSSSQAGPATRPKTGMEMVVALKELQELKAGGIIDSPQAKSLKEKILSDL